MMRSTSSSKNTPIDTVRFLLLLTGLLAMLFVSAYSIPVQQQCEMKYVVHRRETTAEIAQKLLIDLDDLLKANNLEVDERITFGQVLCIPLVGKAGQPVIALDSNLIATHTEYTISLTAYGLGPNTDYVVRVLTSTSPLEWYIYGQFISDANGKIEQGFDVPGRLRRAKNITICLYNALSEASACTVSRQVAVYDVPVPIPNIAVTDEFTATYDNGRLTITATDLIDDHGYFVRVRTEGSSKPVRLGTLIVDSKGEGAKTFRLPPELEGGGILEVCLKDVYNDESFCAIISIDEPRQRIRVNGKPSKFLSPADCCGAFWDLALMVQVCLTISWGLSRHRTGTVAANTQVWGTNLTQSECCWLLPYRQGSAPGYTCWIPATTCPKRT